MLFVVIFTCECQCEFIFTCECLVVSETRRGHQVGTRGRGGCECEEQSIIPKQE